MDKPHIFISYGREDLDQVRRLKELLTENGLTAWLDVDELLPGEKWRVRIEQALASAEVVLICLSNRSASRGGFRLREIRWALDAVQERLDSDIYLIPVRLEECAVPAVLSEFQYVDAFSERSLERLIIAVREALYRRRPQSAQQSSTNLPPENVNIIDLGDLGGAGLLERFLRRGRTKSPSEKP